MEQESNPELTQESNPELTQELVSEPEDPLAIFAEEPKVHPADQADFEEFGEHNIRFLRFTGVRPAVISDKYPQFDPSRDYVNLTRIINNVINSLGTASLTWWKPLCDKLQFSIEQRDPVTGRDQFSPQMLEAINGVIAYVDAAYGKVGETYIEDPRQYKSFENAVADLFKCNGEGLLIVLAHLGAELLDMLFFGARQDRLIGRKGKFTMDELMQTVPRYAELARTGERTAEEVVIVLQRAVRLAVLAGFTGRQIEAAVDKIVIEEMT